MYEERGAIDWGKLTGGSHTGGQQHLHNVAVNRDIEVKQIPTVGGSVFHKLQLSWNGYLILISSSVVLLSV